MFNQSLKCLHSTKFSYFLTHKVHWVCQQVHWVILQDALGKSNYKSVYTWMQCKHWANSPLKSTPLLCTGIGANCSISTKLFAVNWVTNLARAGIGNQIDFTFFLVGPHHANTTPVRNLSRVSNLWICSHHFQPLQLLTGSLCYLKHHDDWMKHCNTQIYLVLRAFVIFLTKPSPRARTDNTTFGSQCLLAFQQHLQTHHNTDSVQYNTR